MTLATLAVRYVLFAEGVTHVLMGCERPEEIEANVAAFERGPLPEELLRSIDALAIPE